tara:strand:+ start:189432 stop:190022 length:591 start_codon:yes stop_codon:yes gene_type:complete
MKKLLVITGLTTLLGLSSASLQAGDKHHKKYYDDDDYRSERSQQETARVTYVEPLYTTVRVSTPQRECYERPQHRTEYPQRESYTSTIAGGLIGGVLGNQFGKGSGNTAMTIAGTLLGGSIGRDAGSYPSHVNSDYDRYDRGQECHITEHVHEEQRIDGYRVTYRYQGQTYTTHMDHHPGKRIPVNVSVQPAHHYY